MPARIEIQIRKIRGPGFDILVERTKEGDIVRVVPPHFVPAFPISPHTAKPKMLTCMWEFPADTQKGTRVIKLVGIELEVFAQYLEGIDRPKWSRWFKLMVDKSGIGLLEVEGVAIMRDGNVAGANELVKLFDEELIVLEAFFVSREIWKRADDYLAFASPAIGEA